MRAANANAAPKVENDIDRTSLSGFTSHAGSRPSASLRTSSAGSAGVEASTAEQLAAASVSGRSSVDTDPSVSVTAGTDLPYGRAAPASDKYAGAVVV